MALNRCSRALVRQLATAGGWCSKADLTAATDYTQARVEEELADLVLAGDVQYNQRAREYRLAGTPLARKALQQLLAGTDKRRILGACSPDKKRYLLGIATRSQAADGEELLTMAELEMPYPAGGPAEIAAAGFAFGAALGRQEEPAP